eukprot:5034569-Amphidinium_carterae.1
MPNTLAKVLCLSTKQRSSFDKRSCGVYFSEPLSMCAQALMSIGLNLTRTAMQRKSIPLFLNAIKPTIIRVADNDSSNQHDDCFARLR